MAKLSFSTIATPGLSGTDAIKLAKRYGYQGVELRVSDHLGELKLSSSRQDVKLLKDMYQSEGIEASGLFCYNKVGNEDPASWNEMADSILANLEIASLLGSQSIRIFGGDPSVSKNYEDFLKRLSETLTTVLDRDKSGIGIQIQNHVNNLGFNDAIKVIRSVNNTRLGLVFSPEHCILCRESYLDKIDEAMPFIHKLFISDFIADDSGYRDVMPGNGEVPHKKVYELLGGKEFRGWVTFKWEKIWHPELEGYEIALPYFIDYFNRVISSGC
jgi:sugar phosphate isomerase/epimerase